jgi:hypothetical protein
MKTNELRLGNYIYWNIPEKQGVVHIIVTLSSGKINTIPISLGNINDYQPIPLTEEWLLKFGFEKRDEKYYLLRYLIEEGISQFFDNGMSFRITTSNTESTHAASIKYVNQLQNLYFALTNTELTIK